jgi:hypothetical protein
VVPYRRYPALPYRNPGPARRAPLRRKPPDSVRELCGLIRIVRQQPPLHIRLLGRTRALAATRRRRKRFANRTLRDIAWSTDRRTIPKSVRVRFSPLPPASARQRTRQ